MDIERETNLKKKEFQISFKYDLEDVPTYLEDVPMHGMAELQHAQQELCTSMDGFQPINMQLSLLPYFLCKLDGHF